MSTPLRHPVSHLLMPLFSLLLAAALGGCGGGGNPVVENKNLAEVYIAKQKTAEATDALNKRILAAAQTDAGDRSDYLLGPGDLIQVTVFEAMDLKSEVRVTSRGYVTLPLIGQVMVKDLTAHDAETKIEDLYRQKYIKDPHVGVFVKEHFSQRVTLIGQIKSPGTYDLVKKFKLMDVLALAGGITEKAGRTIEIRRISGLSQGDGAGLFIIDIDALVKEGKEEQNLEINGGDVIFVSEAGTFYVDGAIRRPGAYPIRSDMTVREAVMTAGGLRPYADTKLISLVRANEQDEKGQRKVLQLDFENAKDCEIPIFDGDIVVAGSSFWAKFSSGMGFNIGLPFFGVGMSNPYGRD